MIRNPGIIKRVSFWNIRKITTKDFSGAYISIQDALALETNKSKISVNNNQLNKLSRIFNAIANL
jgi:hypothetical protein